jgi:benzoyl-CoA reductase subunit D
MITAGIDIGARDTKVAIVKDDKEILALGTMTTGFDQRASAEEALKQTLEKAKVAREEVKYITGTGVGRKAVPHATGEITEIGAGCKGAFFLFPSVRTIVDVGAEEGRAIKCDEKGNMKDFAINEKCAAGAGTFIEAMARALEVPIEEFSKLSLKSTKSIPMNAQCVIFAESEVVSLIHAKTPYEDIVKAIHDAIADRIASMVRRVGIEREVVLVGGMAKNVGFAESLKKTLEVDILIPREPEYIPALGAALFHE